MTDSPDKKKRKYEVRNAWFRAKYKNDPEFRKKVQAENRRNWKKRMEADPVAREAHNLRVKKWRKAYYNIDKVKRMYANEGLKRRTGMTLDDKERMFNAQGRCCALCRTPEPNDRKTWCLDHNHDTGDVRGVLCGRCNTLLGGYETLIKRVGRTAIEKYLDGWPVPEELPEAI